MEREGARGKARCGKQGVVAGLAALRVVPIARPLAHAHGTLRLLHGRQVMVQSSEGRGK